MQNTMAWGIINVNKNISQENITPDKSVIKFKK